MLLKNELKYVDNTWDFTEDNTKISNHGFHTYPAMMIPQVARRLIEIYGKNAKVLFDPFMGSGTSLLEAKLHKNFKTAYGIDINPLALLVAKVKTTPIDDEILLKELHKLCDVFFEHKLNIDQLDNLEIPDRNNLDFWFKPDVIRDLAILKNSIESITIEDKVLEGHTIDFFKVAFSEIVRRVSNTRNSEFKLYKMAEPALNKHMPDTLAEFTKKAKFNIEQMAVFNEDANNCEIKILSEDTRFETSIPSNSVDIIVTSPPYGDSRTTVAYGQFSRLSLEWIGFKSKDVSGIDKTSLGGIPTSDIIHNLNSPTLQKVLDEIHDNDSKRVRDVLSFYVDFNECIKEIDRVMKIGGLLCFVVGNRTVKGVKIPTDEIIVELFKSNNEYKHHNTIIRNIPLKRMPKKNSPTNVKGALKSTMNEEYIVILEKK